MIYKLRSNFISISALSLLVVLFVIIGVMVTLNITQLNRSVDELTDILVDNRGELPPPGVVDRAPKNKTQRSYFLTKESLYSTRYFTASFDRDGHITDLRTVFILSVSDETAAEYAEKALNSGHERGWISHFRFKVTHFADKSAVVFVDGSTNMEMSKQFILSAAAVLFASGALVMLLIVIFSKRAVKPVAESYEKQNQFITDANHELKTPLTLILTNLDIAESELGKNEWLDDIRSEGRRMSVLINKLVMLTRMDESGSDPKPMEFDLSETVKDVVSEFKSIAADKGRRFFCDAPDEFNYSGDESLIRQLISILMDNAVKYCDDGGEIYVSLTGKRHPVLCVENTYADVDTSELDKLFDRFYRSDKARTFDGGYGVGLSIAKMIVQKHGGEIKAYKAGAGRIGFKAVLK